MSRWLQLAERAAETSETLTDTQQEPSKSPSVQSEVDFLPLSAGCREAKSMQKDGRDRHRDSSSNQPDDPKITLRSHGDTSPYGTSPGGRPVTYSGKVVSLDAWRSLSEWERHGPRQRRWSGKEQQWIEERADD